MPGRAQSLRDLVTPLPVDPDVADVATVKAPATLLALVAIGGAAGSLTRAAIALAVPVAAHGWPTATLLVNVCGSLLLGLLLAAVHERFRATWWARPLLGTGFCGGFTTFSTFAVEVTSRSGNGSAGVAIGYLLVSVVASLVAAAGGVLLARVLLRLAAQR